MFTHPATKVSNEHVDQIVKSILTRRQKNLREQQQTFIRRNTDENNKRNNYLVDKFTMKKPTKFAHLSRRFPRSFSLHRSSKENTPTPPTKLVSPKKKTPLEIPDDDDDDFVSTRKRPKIDQPPKVKPPATKIEPIKACLESILVEIENEDATCPICNQILSNFFTIDQREQHVNQCLEESQIKSVNQGGHLELEPSASHLDRKQTATNFIRLSKVFFIQSKAHAITQFQMSNLRNVV